MSVNAPGLDATDRAARGGYANSRSLRALHAALAGRQSAGANIYAFGDSVTEGMEVDNITTLAYTQRWTERLAHRLRELCPTVGEFISPQIPNFIPAISNADFASLWTITGTYSADLSKGVGANSAQISASGVTSLLRIPTGIDTVVLSSVGGSTVGGFTLSIDGAADSSGTYLSGQTTGSVRPFLSAPIPLNPGLTHSILLTTASSTINWLHGAFCFAGNSASGIRIFNAGHSGARIHQYGGTTGAALFSWIDLTIPTQTTNGMSSWDAYPPDCVLMAHGLNDYSSAFGDGSAANFKTDTLNFITAVRARYPTRQISFVLLSTYERGDPAQSDPWSAFLAAKDQLAASDPDICHFDWGRRMPKADFTNPPASQLGYYHDTAHPFAKGHMVMGDLLTRFLVPR